MIFSTMKSCVVSAFLLLSSAVMAGTYSTTFSGVSGTTFTANSGVVADNWTCETSGTVDNLDFNGGVNFTLLPNGSLTMTSGRSFTGQLISVSFSLGVEIYTDIQLYRGTDMIGVFVFDINEDSYSYQGSTAVINLNDETLAITFQGSAAGGETQVQNLQDVSVVVKEVPGLAYTDQSSQFVIGEGTEEIPNNSYGFDTNQLQSNVNFDDLVNDIIYQSDNENVAKVLTDGKVEIHGCGTASISASYPGSAEYEQDGASYTLTVTLARPVFNQPQGKIYFSDQEFTMKASADYETIHDVQTIYAPENSQNPVEYNGSFTLSGNGLKRLTANNVLGTYYSKSTTAEYYVYDAPTISLAAGTYQGPQTVTITDIPAETVDYQSPQVYYYFDNAVADTVLYKAGDEIVIDGSKTLNVFLQIPTGKVPYTSSVISADYIIEPVIEPLDDDKAVTFDDDDFVVVDEHGVETPADLSNYTVNGILYTLNTGVDGEGYDGSGDEGAICLVSTLTDDQVAEVAKNVANETSLPGSDSYANSFTGGITFMIEKGSGVIELDGETSENFVFHVKIGTGEPFEVASLNREVMQIPYDVEADTYVYIYLVAKSKTRAVGHIDPPVNMIGRRETSHGRIYSLRCCAGKAYTPPTDETDDPATDDPATDDPATEDPATETTVEMTIGDSGKITYCGEKALDFTDFDDLKAYVVTGYDDESQVIWLTRVNVAPAETPLLVKGTPKKTYQVPFDENANAYYENMLVGNLDEDTTIGETDGSLTNYYLGGGKFKKVNGSAPVKKGKAYLQLPSSFEAPVVGEDQIVTINSSGKSSYAPSVDVDLTDVEGLKAYTATGYDAVSQTIWMTRVNKIQAGEGVLLKGEAGKTYTLPSAAAQAYYGNMFVGNIDGPVTIYETSDDGKWQNYYLANGKYNKVSTSQTIQNNKSYLHLPTSLLVSSARGKGFGADEKTKIDAVRQTDDSNEVFYNLQGQRVIHPGKGLYIMNGKKVIVR